MTTYTNINGIALIGTGEESGTWGTLTNLNLQALDRATHGFSIVDLGSAGAAYDLLTDNIETSASLNEKGNYKALQFNSATENCTISIKSNEIGDEFTQTKVYHIFNNTSFTLIFSQNNGAETTSVSAGKKKVIVATGTGEVVDYTDGLELTNVVIESGSVTSSSVSITGGTITGITDLAIADGGTGAGTAADARTNLGLVIGTDVQAYDAGLTDIAGLTPNDSNFIVGDGTNWVAEDAATALTSLGVTATAAELNYNDLTTLGTSEASKVVTADANGDVNIAEQLTVKSNVETASSVTSSGNISTLDCSLANHFYTVLSEDTDLAFSNVPASGKSYSCTLEIIQDAVGGSYAFDFTADVIWAGGSSPSLSSGANEIDVFTFTTRDGGLTWYGFVSGLNMS